MFSQGHLIWILISAVLVAVLSVYLFKRRPALKNVFKVCLILGIVSEVIKVFSVAQIVPMVDPVIASENGSQAIAWIPTGEYTPYIAMEHMPLELCSLYLFFMPLALIIKDEKWKKRLYALMFVSGTIGGMMGIILSSIAGDFETTAAFFSAPRAWQFFLFHSMIVSLSLYIGFGDEAGLRFGDWKKAVVGILVLDVPTFYINSLLSSEIYMANQVVGVSHRINFFSSYVNPLGLILTEKWQWIVYLMIRAAMATCLIIILYLPMLARRRRS
ncbi:MAG: YwaF family protein [Oscillospiraceae bacterium]|nr:YwaF family protein [Oscillospiraceae bacterium]